MTADQESRSPLETEPVQKLIVRYAIPTALTLMVNCLYNIVDQIFVGQGGDHRHGGHQRGVPGGHSGECRGPAAGRRQRRQHQPVPRPPPAARGG
ncbi:MAG: hypothetical protein ACLTYN_11795 [Dysosmobacter welbionis]